MKVRGSFRRWSRNIWNRDFCTPLHTGKGGNYYKDCAEAPVAKHCQVAESGPRLWTLSPTCLPLTRNANASGSSILSAGVPCLLKWLHSIGMAHVFAQLMHRYRDWTLLSAEDCINQLVLSGEQKALLLFELQHLRKLIAVSPPIALSSNSHSARKLGDLGSLPAADDVSRSVLDCKRAEDAVRALFATQPNDERLNDPHLLLQDVYASGERLSIRSSPSSKLSDRFVAEQ